MENELHTMYEVFADSAARHADLPAIELPGRPVTFTQLRRAAEVMAEVIVRAGGRDGVSRVGLLASRSVVAYAGYLAALRLGAGVVPLNLDYPARRNGEICELAGVEVLVADAAGQKWLAREAQPGGPAGIVLAMSDTELLAAAPSDRLAPHKGRADDVAYLLFTSGSTGRPKGVPIRHRNVLPLIRHNLTRFHVQPGCRLSHTFDLTFDPSVYDMFVSWAGGATLVVPEPTGLFDLGNYLLDRKISHWFSVPSIVSVSAQLGTLPKRPATSLRYSAFCGEQLLYSRASEWRDLAPRSAIDNLYGPTELTITCADYRLPADSREWPQTSNDTVPIGSVYPGLDHVVKAENGELCVRGVQRFSGYLSDADNVGRFLDYDGSAPLTDRYYYQTGDRVRDEGGALVHLGRLDDQVKIRGQRIELGELEAVLRRHPKVSQAVFVALPSGAGKELVGCYIGEPVPLRELRRILADRLPNRLVPHRIVRLENLPLNANGKVDRAAIISLLRADEETASNAGRGPRSESMPLA
jgi:amino acid adenylation domain-containing protein